MELSLLFNSRYCSEYQSCLIFLIRSIEIDSRHFRKRIDVAKDNRFIVPNFDIFLEVFRNYYSVGVCQLFGRHTPYSMCCPEEIFDDMFSIDFFGYFRFKF